MKYSYLGKTGMKVPVLSFGASSLGGVFHSVREAEAIRAVFTAIEHGMNFIDVSPYYGHTKAETVLGKALTELPGKLSEILRRAWDAVISLPETRSRPRFLE